MTLGPFPTARTPLRLALAGTLALAACARDAESASDGGRSTILPALMPQGGTNADAKPPEVPFSASTPRLQPSVVRTWAHDTTAYTQGLLFHEGRVFESTGLEGRSRIRELDTATLAPRRQVALPASDFGEGIAAVGARLYQLTWKGGLGRVYDIATLAPVDSFHYEGEGWGLASNGRLLYMSDGSSEIRVIDPDGFRELRRFRVTEAGRRVWALNELEWVRGELWANVYETTFIARIDPATGQVTGWVDLAGLSSRFTASQRNAIDAGGGVANGIAFDSTAGTLLVTGKLWPRVFQLAWPPEAAMPRSGGNRIR
ncbi:MAG: glutamine cyclotransferase [Gemmatimonadetes bacterium]|jgi:glutamine cyclotransferase|nr:glutamine cyclotransferase [Gemmatimonadota bacterium]